MGMRLSEADISRYEGLIYATAARYAPLVDDDLEDVQQLLRVKVAQAICSFDPRRTRLPEERYVFACLRNRVKDLLKAQTRLNDRRGGRQLYSDDLVNDSQDFERRYLAADPDQVYARIEDEAAPLPSTLSELERRIVVLLTLDYSQGEVAVILGVSRKRVRLGHRAIQEKMADWKPSTPVAPGVAA